METQNLVISFDYSWFLAKNLAYAECPIMKFHYRNSSTVDKSKVEISQNFVAFSECMNFTWTLESVQDFLIKLDIQPQMEISTK